MTDAPSKEQLKKLIMRNLRKQGFHVRKGKVELPQDIDKDGLRDLHSLAVNKRRCQSEQYLRRFEREFVLNIANGSEVNVKEISPRLVEVQRDSFDELLFRWISIHWSIPVSSGYGRRIRFIIRDEQNGKVIGLLGLGDPVFGLASRDRWIGWDHETRRKNLYHVMDAFVLGAVPPYSKLICGKLIALLTLSNPVRKVYIKKYKKQQSKILGETRPPYLALVTTTSALGRSSVYNRLAVNGVKFWHPLGFTKGSGDFHFSDGVYDAMRAFALENCIPTAKHEAWGSGFRNKREVIRKCLAEVGLSPDIIYHGIGREIFAAPLGKDSLRFLRGEVSRPKFYNWSVQDLSAAFQKRWLLPRALWDERYKDFVRDEYILWGSK